MNLSLPQDKEMIKNHMVAYLAKTGSVSKTLFGIELGTVCKFPTRGRTKMLIEAYPDVFVAEGDMVHLRQPPSQFQGVPQEPSPFVSQQFDNYPFLPQNTSAAFSSAVLPPDAHFYQLHPSPSFPPPPPPFYAESPQQGNVMYASRGMHKTESQSKVMFPEYSEGVAVSEYMETQLVTQSGELQVPLPQESDALAVLNKHGGSLEVSVLLAELGAKESNPFEQAQLFEFLTKCNGISIQEGVAYVIERSGQNSPQPSKMDEAGYVDLAAVHQPSQATSAYATVEKLKTSCGAVPRDLHDAQTITVDSIHIDSVNVEVVNLHLHIENRDKLEMSKLVELQKFMQQQFQAYLNQKQQL